MIPENTDTQLKADGQSAPCSAFAWARYNDATVNAMLCGGASHTSIIAVLASEKADLMKRIVERDEAQRIWSIYQDQCAELRERYAMHHAEAELITIDNIRLKCTLAKWIEWARMHGHLEHAAGIADDSRRLISPENVKGDSQSPTKNL